MSDWNYLNERRVLPRHNQYYGTNPDAGFNGMFELPINGLPVRVLASDGEGWQHVSVSIVGSHNPPSWSMMCQIKDLFFEPEDWVCQFHPAQSEYVNMHPGCLHLWKPTKEKLPTPDRLMVGYKNAADVERAKSFGVAK